jgi:hypothetical protein
VGSGNRSAGSASAAKHGKTAALRENVGGEFKGQGPPGKIVLRFDETCST